MNDTLFKTFSGEEVWEALQDMGGLKAPSADGISVIFYKKFWSLVGGKVKGEVLSVLNVAGMPQDWNDSIIVLIPKRKNPERL
jgi:hypothetical protein